MSVNAIAMLSMISMLSVLGFDLQLPANASLIDAIRMK